MPDDYERQCAQIRTENKEVLARFSEWLSQKGLSEKTISTHVSNIDFYINAFLLYEDATRPEEGVNSVNMFLGYWFIRKAMWASPSAIKSNAASLKKFYRFLHEQGRIDARALDDLRCTIREGMPEWMETMNRYDNPDIEDMNEVWGF